MHIKPHHRLSCADVRQLARDAAARHEPLDTANMFALGTNHHATFTTEYLSCLLAGNA